VVDQLSGHGADNVGVFEDNGSPRKLHPLLLDPSPGRASLHIAGFALTGDDLYIANSWRKDSHIALYHRHGAIRSLARPIMLSE